MTHPRKRTEGSRLRRGDDARVLPCVASLAAAVLASVTWPSTASALCPNCLGQARALTPTMELVGVFLLVPFVVFLVVLRVIRRASRL